MNQNWLITPTTIAKVRQFWKRYQDNEVVIDRIKRNLRPDKKQVKKARFWKEKVIAINTTQTRSGPGSGVDRLANADPFRLSYGRCLEAKNVKGFVADVLAEYGLRFGPKNAPWIARNLSLIRGKNNEVWERVDAELEKVRLRQDQATEREAARFLQKKFDGLGPKQSRNVLQGLGLTRYETPLDSRVTKWLARMGLAVEYRLGSEGGYCRVMDDFQDLCKECGVVPCALDAAIFASFDCHPRTGCRR